MAYRNIGLCLDLKWSAAVFQIELLMLIIPETALLLLYQLQQLFLDVAVAELDSISNRSAILWLLQQQLFLPTIVICNKIISKYE